MKLNSKNLRLILVGGLALSILGFFGALIIGLSSLGAKSKSMVELQVKSQTADAQLSNLQSSKKQVEKYAYFKDVAKTVIPNDKNQAAAILEIDNMATKSGIAIQSITFPASTLGLRTVLPQDATASTSTQNAISQAKPVTGIPGLYSLELTITPASGIDATPATQITYAKMLDFLGRIENNRHTAQISEVNITPPNSGGANNSASLSFSLVINIFIKP